MSSSSRGRGPWFHIQGAGLLGVIAGTGIAGIFSLAVSGVVIGIALIVFVLFFNKTLWPLISRKGLYEGFFGLNQQASPLIYIAEGVAGGIVLGGVIGLISPGYLVLILVVVGGLVLVFRYHETLRLLVSTVRERTSAGTPRSSQYRQLLRKAGGDAQLVERLIAYEKQRAPHASREECIERAIMRWERDKM